MENFYIGQEVVCIRTHSKNYFIKDKVYKIQSLRVGCSHSTLLIDIGIKGSNYGTMCPTCNTIWSDNKNLWCCSSSFAPICKNLIKLKLKEVIKKEEHLLIEN